MEVNQALTLGFACFTETAMLHHAFTTFLERNDVKAKYYWLALLLYAFCVLFTAGNSFSIYFVSLFCYSLIVLFSLIFFRNQMEVKLIVSFMFVALNYAFTVLAATFLWQIHHCCCDIVRSNNRIVRRGRCLHHKGFIKTAVIDILFTFTDMNEGSLRKSSQ